MGIEYAECNREKEEKKGYAGSGGLEHEELGGEEVVLGKVGLVDG